jgi:CRISPR-associated protein Cas1
VRQTSRIVPAKAGVEMITTNRLARPNAARTSALSMVRMADRTSFLYLDLCRIEQDDNGTHARVESEAGEVRTTYLPVATLTCLLLGPGTSITAPAANALARNGCAVVFVGAGGVRSYSSFSPVSKSVALLNAQARASAVPQIRTAIAQRMLRMRFPEVAIPELNTDGTPVTLEQLRGLEGARMKAFYQLEARKRRLRSWRRRKDESDGRGPLDEVNTALNYANTALYGLCLGVICGLGMSPGLGVVHEGNGKAFVLDVADLYKTQVTIPLAFRQAKSANPGRDVMRSLRDDFTLLRLLPRIVDDLHNLFEVHDDGVSSGWDINPLSLWGSDGELVEAEYNRHGRDETLR